MGYYIEVPHHLRKAEQIVELYGGVIVARPRTFTEIPKDKALVVVVDNELFEAAGVAYCEEEFLAFTQDSHDTRPRKFVLLDKEKAFLLSGVPQRLVDNL